MTRVQELKEKALMLSEAERAVLASESLQTLPSVLTDEDEGATEALRRESDLASNPAAGIDWPTLKLSASPATSQFWFGQKVKAKWRTCGIDLHGLC